MTLVEHLSANGYMDEALSVVLAYHLGVRPCEMRTIMVTGSSMSDQQEATR